ncbi:hypothetical protein Bca4012_054955 [Brassica carinata]|uniref:Uncharacterized protein n=2 Tax=Brassica TaxID=3705 RepID=A0A3P6FQ71_BRAOL|nr:unnamed protein product [Brassica napus]CAF2030768.1 unnamed protein product [Brassica napus]VDD46632.1 unnamed protein product [Brassica oleracea]
MVMKVAVEVVFKLGLTLGFKKRALGLLRLIRIYISLSGRNTELDVIITRELEKVYHA